MSSTTAMLRSEAPGLIHRGKVRDVCDLGDRLLIVATDRISAFDVVMNEPIPNKGRVLTELTRFWLETLPACMPHHLDYVVTRDRCPKGYEAHADALAGRAMVVRKAKPLPVECIVRGYLIGSGWKEYQQSGAVCGVALPSGLKLADRLARPIFTPSTKAEAGHDEPITFEQACELGGREWVTEARDRSLAIFEQATRYAEPRGIILADTKFEFGVCDGKLLLIDEVLTPDSSRFWPMDRWRPGQNPPSFDKQYLRDYLETLSWNKTPPPPPIPENVLRQTGARYEEALRLLTGRSVA